MWLQLIPVDEKSVEHLLDLMQAYYRYDQLDFEKEKAHQAVLLLLADDRYGRIWLISFDNLLVGYLAVTFGFSLEFGGKDAFIDEFFILEEFRNQGIGKKSLQLAENFLKQEQVQALHLEVNEEHEAAKLFYTAQGFRFRERFHLMSKDLNRIDKENGSQT